MFGREPKETWQRLVALHSLGKCRNVTSCRERSAPENESSALGRSGTCVVQGQECGCKRVNEVILRAVMARLSSRVSGSLEVSEEQFELPAHLSHNGSSIGRLNSLLNAPTGTSEGPKLQASPLIHYYRRRLPRRHNASRSSPRCVFRPLE
jgi:hypothetical protein